MQKRRVSVTIAAWAKLSAEDWCNAASGTRLEADYALSFTPRIPLYSSTFASLTDEHIDATDQPVPDNQQEIQRVKITDVIGEAGVDPFDEMLDEVDNAQFLPPDTLDPDSQFRCPPDNQVFFPGDEVSTEKVAP
ncbi:MAG: hypothetical protein ACK55I_36170 [bacterium]